MRQRAEAFMMPHIEKTTTHGAQGAMPIIAHSAVAIAPEALESRQLAQGVC